MTQSERFGVIERMLLSRRNVSFSDMQQRLGVSRATLFRDLRDLKDRMQVPIILDRDTDSYRIDTKVERTGEIRSVAQDYLTRIQRAARDGQCDLLGCVSKFGKSVEVRLQEKVQTDLAEIGGKPIKTAMVLEFGSDKLMLSGYFGAKPAQPRKSPERYERVGRVVGLNSHRKRLQVFSSEEIEFECDPNQFAHHLRDAIHTPRCFVFGVLRSTDAKGREQLVLTDAEEIDSPPGDPESLI
jgi:hypothetical protein